MLGGGLAILVGATPHEDLLVGAALALFGLAIVVTAPLPRLPAAPGWLLATVGALLAGGILTYNAITGGGWDVPKIAIVTVGAVLLALAPLTRRSIRLRGGQATIGSLVTLASPAIGAPLAVWALQAAFKSAIGATPLEAFIHVALLLPINLFLQGLGLGPTLQGQTVTYATPRGPLSLEVGAACSGIQAMALFAGVLAIFLWSERPPGKRLAIWSVIGLVGVYVANLLRLAVLVLVGYQWGPQMLLRVHADAGWIFFVAWAILFAWLARRSRPVLPPKPA